MTDIKQLRKDIKLAQEWALKHFNAADATDPRLVDDDLNLLPPRFFVVFPDVNKMIVQPSLMGKPGYPQFRYTLHIYKSGKITWQAKHPFYNTLMPELVVREGE